jgi:hypothetical protein
VKKEASNKPAMTANQGWSIYTDEQESWNGHDSLFAKDMCMLKHNMYVNISS